MRRFSTKDYVLGVALWGLVGLTAGYTLGGGVRSQRLSEATHEVQRTRMELEKLRRAFVDLQPVVDSLNVAVGWHSGSMPMTEWRQYAASIREQNAQLEGAE